MYFLPRLLVGLLVLILSACGGEDSSSVKQSASSLLSKSTADSEGRFRVPIMGEEFGGNLLVDFSVSDLDGLKDVSLSFNQQPQRFSLCRSPENCSGTQFESVIGGIYPGDYSANPGLISLGLWVTDQTDTEMQVSSVAIYWQPQQINDVLIERNSEGDTINVSWPTNSQLLRYNLYLAAQPGVNQYTFSELDEGQAVLAIDGQQHLFESLNPDKTYYILLVGIDGSGESAFTQEYLVESDGDINIAPEAQDDAYLILQDTLLVVAISNGLLINDSDPNSDVIIVDIEPVTEPSSGTLVLAADGSFTYMPAPGFVGEDTFSYQILDPELQADTATVTITVEPGTIVNIAPVAEDDAFSMFQGTQLIIAKSSGLLVNDSDPESAAITVDTVPVIEPSSGSLVLAEDGSFTYIPFTGFVGVDTFSYQILDPELLSDAATVTITVQPVPETLLGDSLSMTGEFLYIGLGELTLGSGIGTGLYRIGDCIQIIDTYCSMTGDYIESDTSGNKPGEMGSYAFTMTYSGTGNSPVQARSIDAGSNVLNFMTVGDALFELYLFPPDGGVIKSNFPDPVFSTLFNFGAFIETSQVCAGLPAGDACTIGNVGLTAGATDTAPLDRLNFTVSGYATVDISNEPIALDDEYLLASGLSSLTVGAPGVLSNDTDADSPLIGDILNVRNQFATTFIQSIALAVDEYRQLLYLYEAFSASIYVFDRAGEMISTVAWQGEGANDADMDVAPVAFSLAGTAIPQGSLLVFNGEIAETEVYAIDPETNIQLAMLNTEFGNSHVVGGAFNPITKTIFLLQDNVPGSPLGNLVAEIDPDTGLVLSSFLINDLESLFNVSFGDLDVNNVTGSLYLVSSIDNRLIELTRDGELIRYIPLPADVSSPSGVAVSNEADRVWFVNNAASSPVFEVSFANQGKFPGLVSSILTPTQNGSVILNLDGSFVYIPNPGFTGQDSFVYQVSDQTGKVAQAKALITVE